MRIIEKNDKTKGLFSSEKYVINDKIYKLQGVTYDKPSRTTIEIGKDVHIDDEYGIFMNHSFTPSCMIKDGYIVALCNINENDELTFNYNSSETSMACPFVDSETNEQVYGQMKLNLGNN